MERGEGGEEKERERTERGGERRGGEERECVGVGVSSGMSGVT